MEVSLNLSLKRALSIIYLFLMKLSCSEDKQPNYNQGAPHFCWVILDDKTVTYILGVKDGQTKRDFF
jgi:hypothetical protein